MAAAAPGRRWWLRIADWPCTSNDVLGGPAPDAGLARRARGRVVAAAEPRSASRAMRRTAGTGSCKRAQHGVARARRSPITPERRAAARAHRPGCASSSAPISAGTERGWRSLPRISAASTRTLYDGSCTSDSSTSSICGACARGTRRRGTPRSATNRRAEQRDTVGQTRAGTRARQCSESLGRATAVNGVTTRYAHLATRRPPLGDIVRDCMSDATRPHRHDLARLFGRRRRRVHVPRAPAPARSTRAAVDFIAPARPHGGAEPAGDRRRARTSWRCRSGVYPAIAARYQMLPHGASVGRGFGPVVVAPRPLAPRDLAGLRVGIPGATTTAWLVLRLIAPGAIGVEIPIAPFAAIFDALARGRGRRGAADPRRPAALSRARPAPGGRPRRAGGTRRRRCRCRSA